MGAKQLTMGIYEVDEKATTAAVEEYLNDAREYSITEFVPIEPTTTAEYSDMPRGYTGTTSDQTGDIAIYNTDEQERRKRHIERVERAVSRLPQRQQKLIRTKYLEADGEEKWDYEIADEIGYSYRHYKRIKSFAIYRLATSLRLIKLKE
ncbi:ArpU family phage packaging/lysis transcriptional regulator [Paenibacillus bouchesdurhonensis]|uniref:ArpU family phage packaging/lysis transcriptional regulator n=1 Tax=Paenibacillus bouchesdurhonensis TaxID=1870990 RepID=UPI001F28390F|nr:ArpU family phage packaging/lysis transcriptional regulator [Paenibacillus bouchesdurhonensis]